MSTFIGFLQAHSLDLAALCLAALSDPSISGLIPPTWAPALLAFRAFLGILLKMYGDYAASHPKPPAG